MKPQYTFTLLFLLCCIDFLFSQQMEFQRAYGNSNSNGGIALPTSDGGYIITSSDYVMPAVTGPGILMKLDSAGDTLWAKAFSGPSTTHTNIDVAMQTTDGGFILSVVPNGVGCRLVKVNSIGDTLWTKLSNVCPSTGDLYLAPDGGYYDVQGVDGIIKTDSLFNVQWGKIIMGGFGGRGKLTLDGGFILWSNTRQYACGGPNDQDLFMVKTDSLGNFLWGKVYGTTAEEDAGNIAQTNDGGYIAIGTSAISCVGNSDVIIIKTDANGNLQWTKTYGGTDGDNGVFIQPVSGGTGYLFTGYNHGFGDIPAQYSYRSFVVKTDFNGNPIWGKIYGDIANNLWNAEDIATNIKPTNDLGFIISGFTQSFGSGDYEMWLIKTNANGESGCREVNSLPSVCIPNLIISSGGYDTAYTPANTGFNLTQSSWHPTITTACFGYAGINEASTIENNISIYPNPSSGKFWVSIPSGQVTSSKSQVTSMEVYNLYGEKVYEQAISDKGTANSNSPYGLPAHAEGGSLITVNLSESLDGIYFVRVQTNQGAVAKKIMIIR